MGATPQTVQIVAVCVTQLTCLAVLGLKPRAFREAVIRHRIKHTRLGNQVVVRVDDWNEAMERLRVAAPEPEGGPVRTASQILASIGVKRSA